MEAKNILLNNVTKIHTTTMGYERISRNLKIKPEDVLVKCLNIVCDGKSLITRKGKNWYIEDNECKITVNAYSYTIITAHKKTRRK